jgi:hypothetical protein
MYVIHLQAAQLNQGLQILCGLGHATSNDLPYPPQIFICGETKHLREIGDILRPRRFNLQQDKIRQVQNRVIGRVAFALLKRFVYPLEWNKQQLDFRAIGAFSR